MKKYIIIVALLTFLSACSDELINPATTTFARGNGNVTGITGDINCFLPCLHGFPYDRWAIRDNANTQFGYGETANPAGHTTCRAASWPARPAVHLPSRPPAHTSCAEAQRP